MDYGKLAYLKAEELEARMGSPVRTAEKAGSAYAAYRPRFSFASGLAYPLCTLSGNGQATLVVKLTVRRDAEIASGALRLTADGSAASRQEISGPAGEETYVLLASVFCPSSLEIAVAPEGPTDGVLTGAEVAVTGGGVGLGRRQADWSADCLNAAAGAAAVIRDEDICLASVTTGGIGAYFAAGKGHAADITAAGNGYCLVYCDDLGNLWGVRFDARLNETARVCLGEAADCVSVAPYRGRLLVACLRSGEASLFTCGTDFGGAGGRRAADLGIRADKLRFVRGSDPPMLCLESDGAAYLKVPACESGDAAVLRVTTGYTLTEET